METTKIPSVSGESMSEQVTLPQTPEDVTMPIPADKPTADAADEPGEKEAAMAAADDEPEPEPEPEYPGNVQLALIMTALLLAMFLISLDQTIVATAIPKITDDFHGLDKVAWYGSAYFLTFAGFLACWGKALQFVKIKWVYLAALLLFELGSLVCAVAPSANALIVGRAIAGVGCSGIGTTAFVAISLACAPPRRPIFLGIMTTTYGISAVVGPLLGGAFTGSAAGWRWCFWINLPVGGVAAAVTVFSFRLVQPQMRLSLAEKIRRLDVGGALLAVGGLVCFILALQYGGQTRPWRSGPVVGLLVGSAAIGAVWAAWQVHQGDRAMVVVRVLVGTRGVWSGALFQFFFGSSYFVGLYYLPIYFQSVKNTSPIGSGIHNLPLVLAITLFSVVGGVLLSRLGRTGPLMAAGAALATVACGLFYTMDEHTSAGRWIGFQILAGLTWGGIFQCSIIASQAGLPVVDVPLSSTINLFAQTVGATLGIAAVQSAFNNTLLRTVRNLAPHIDSGLVLTTGATQIRSVFSGNDLTIIVHAYVEALRVVWAIDVALAGISFVVSFVCRWERLYPKTAKALPVAAV